MADTEHNPGQQSQNPAEKASQGEQGLDSPVFRGVFYHALDDKGRVSFPAEFRRVLSAAGESSLVLTNFISDGTRCLEGFSLSAWRSFERKLAARSRFDPQVRKLENFYLARAAICPLDSSGRVNVPPYLRTYAGLEKEVAFTSSSHGFRIWDRRVWDLVFQEAEAALLENPGLFIDADK
jgi:MraZ protein